MPARILLLLLASTALLRAQALPDPAPAEPEPAAFSLTAAFEPDLATQEWTLVKGAPPPHWHPPGQPQRWPLHLVLINAATGARAALQPAAYFATENRHRWGGRTLGVDWVLVLDGLSNEHLRVSGQFKTASPQTLALEAGLTLDLKTWSWHDGPWQRAPLHPELPPRRDAQPDPLGQAGLQADSPLSVISRDDVALVLEAGLIEPLSFYTLADPGARWWGAQLSLATDPRTEKFPGRAAFVLDFRQLAPGGATAYRSAAQTYAQRGLTARTWRLPEEGLQTDDAAFATANGPAIYRRGELRTGFAQAVPLELNTDATGRADWQALTRWTVRDAAAHVDEFGSTNEAVHRLLLSSTSTWPHRVHLLPPPTSETYVLADPATGALEPMVGNAGDAAALWIEPGQDVLRDVFALADLQHVRAYYQSEAPDHAGTRTLVENLDTWSKLQALESSIQVRMERLALTGRDHPVTLIFSNSAQTQLTLLQAERSGVSAQPLLSAPRKLPPGGHVELSGFIDPASLQTPRTPIRFSWTLERKGAVVEATWTENLAVQPPLWTALPTGSVVTLDDHLVLSVPVWNRSETPRAATLIGQGDFSPAPVSVQLEPGEQRVIQLNLPADPLRRGRLHLQLVNADRVCAEQILQLEFLAPEASLARDDRVSAETAGTLTGTSLRALRDGDHASTWQADPALTAPWVSYRFPEPTAISEVTLVWAPGAASQRGQLRGFTAAGEEVHLATFSNDTAALETRIFIGDVHLQSLTLLQPAGGGPADQPNVLRLNELEVR